MDPHSDAEALIRLAEDNLAEGNKISAECEKIRQEIEWKHVDLAEKTKLLDACSERASMLRQRAEELLLQVEP